MALIRPAVTYRLSEGREHWRSTWASGAVRRGVTGVPEIGTERESGMGATRNTTIPEGSRRVKRYGFASQTDFGQVSVNGFVWTAEWSRTQWPRAAHILVPSRAQTGDELWTLICLTLTIRLPNSFPYGSRGQISEGVGCGTPITMTCSVSMWIGMLKRYVF